MKVDSKAIEIIRADLRVAWTEDVLRFRDLDANGHVNNAVFATLCESGRVDLFRTGLGPTEPDRFFVIARLLLDFLGELHYPGTATTGTWVTSVGRTSVGLGQIILDADGRPVARSDAVCVSLASDTRRPAPLGPEVRARAERLLRPAAPRQPLEPAPSRGVSLWETGEGPCSSP